MRAGARTLNPSPANHVIATLNSFIQQSRDEPPQHIYNAWDTSINASNDCKNPEVQ